MCTTTINIQQPFSFLSNELLMVYAFPIKRASYSILSWWQVHCTMCPHSAAVAATTATTYHHHQQRQLQRRPYNPPSHQMHSEKCRSAFNSSWL